MNPIGAIKYLQIQREPLKTYVDGIRTYETQAIQQVSSLMFTLGGIVIHENDKVLLDVHHVDHPKTRYRGDNSISVAWLPNYHAMQERFGPHMQVGVAGENIVIEPIAGGTPLTAGMRLLIGDPQAHHIILAPIEPAPPCVEFSRFCLRATSGSKVIKETLQFLSDGVRGYYTHLQTSHDLVQIQINDVVYQLD